VIATDVIGGVLIVVGGLLLILCAWFLGNKRP